MSRRIRGTMRESTLINFQWKREGSTVASKQSAMTFSFETCRIIMEL